MLITPFSKHIFWSYKKDADLPDNIIIKQVIAFGEIPDLLLIKDLFSKEKIYSVLENWTNKDQYKKRINFIEKVILHDQQ